MVNTPKSQHRLRIHQFTDLLSRNFKKLSTQSISLTKNKGTMDSPSKRSLESSKIMTETTFPIPFPIDFQGSLSLSLSLNMCVCHQIFFYFSSDHLSMVK